MLQIINISQARSNLSSLIKQVSHSKKPVIIIQDSIPSAILYPYDNSHTDNQYKQQLLNITGNWFNPEEHKKLRSEVQLRIKKTPA